MGQEVSRNLEPNAPRLSDNVSSSTCGKDFHTKRYILLLRKETKLVSVEALCLYDSLKAKAYFPEGDSLNVSGIHFDYSLGESLRVELKAYWRRHPANTWGPGLPYNSMSYIFTDILWSSDEAADMALILASNEIGKHILPAFLADQL